MNNKSDKFKFRYTPEAIYTPGPYGELEVESAYLQLLLAFHLGESPLIIHRKIK